MPGGFQFDGSSSSNDNVKKTTLCSTQPENPQDGPIDPSRLFATHSSVSVKINTNKVHIVVTEHKKFNYICFVSSLRLPSYFER